MLDNETACGRSGAFKKRVGSRILRPLSADRQIRGGVISNYLIFLLANPPLFVIHLMYDNDTNHRYNG